MEKSSKFKRVLKSFIGNSILFDRGDEVWAEKRKHLSSAFYKDKLLPMMNTVISVTNQTVQNWKKSSKKSIDLTAEVSDLVTECVLQCVFGESSEKLGRLSHV
jgi:cytochrome P450